MAADPSRLSRRLGLFDAVVIGLGAMIGAGVFAAIGPAAQVAGSGLLIGLAIAAAVAYCNATSSAQLAAVFPQSGGTYVYGRQRLGAFWGYLAGWGFVVGKTASCAAMALTFGSYAAPKWRRPLAIAAVVGLTAVNYRGGAEDRVADSRHRGAVLAALATVVAGALLFFEFPVGGHGEDRAADAHHAELAVGALVGAVVLLTYYAIANASAWTLPVEQRRWPRWLAAAGVMGCVVLALTLPAASVVSGAAVLATGALIWLARRSVSPSRPA